MLERLFSGPVAAALAEELATVSPTGWIAAIDVLSAVHKLEVPAHLVVIESRARALRKVRGPALVADAGALPFAPRTLAALVCPLPSSSAALAQAASVVENGGRVIAIGTGDARKAATAVLAAGLMEPRQRRVGRTVICSAVVATFE